jgi:OFA family oxalate/formate antiporter-like MFS transporter
MDLLNNKWTRGAIPAVFIHGAIGSVYAWSLFVKPISQYINQSESKVQFAFSLAIFFLGMSAAFGGKVVEKNIKKSSLISCICFCSGLLLTALAIYMKNLILIYLGYGCLMGIGLGVGYITPVKTLMLWFKDNKGLATGISVCAFGFASSIASPIITYLTNCVSLTTTFIYLSILYFVPMIVAHFMICKPSGWTETNNSFNSFQMFKDKKFIAVWLIVYLNIHCGLSLISIASPLMNELSIKTSLIAIVVSIMGIFNGAGRLVFSTASDKLNNRTNIYLIIASLSFVTVLVSSIFQFSISYIVVLIVVSACYGAGFSCLPTLLSDIYGMDNISKIHGLSLTAWAIAGLTGNQMSSLIKNHTEHYTNVLYVLLILYLIEFIIILYLKNKTRKTV